jgi:hypothetical protein
MPVATWLALLALGFALAQGLAAAAEPRGDRPRDLGRRLSRGLLILSGLGLLAFSGWLTLQSGKQLKLQQALTNGGLRREIGLWLKAQAKPGDRVFLEPLGYIGFYSNLKTFDFPGMSSPEMVQAVREEGINWMRIIQKLDPEWVVLRPLEVIRNPVGSSALLNRKYEIARVFDVRGLVAGQDIYGRGYLDFDASFIVFRRMTPPSSAQGSD